MAQGKRDINIFRVLEKMKDALALIEARNTMMMSEDESEVWCAEQRRFLVEGKDVRARLVEEFSEFLFSCEWTNSPVVREIVGYIENGTSLNQIGKQSGKDFDRIGYISLKQDMLRSGDTLVITELDRLGRNKAKIKEELEWFRAEGIRVKILNVPTTLLDCEGQDWVLDMVSNILIEVMASVAEEERVKIHQRQEEGIAVAKAKGVVFGRPPIAKPDNYEQVMTLVDAGQMKAVDAMRELGIKKTTYYKLRQVYWQAADWT